MSLPNTFTRLKYLKRETASASGGPYINTGILATNIGKIEIKFSYDARIGNYDAIVYAEQSSSPYYGCGIRKDNANRIRVQYGDGNLQSIPYELGTIHEINVDYTLSSNNAIIDGVPYSISHVQAPPNCNIFVFGSNLSTNTFSAGSRSTIYYLKIYNTSGTLVRDFVPAKRKLDNVIGLYDLENNQFYSNAGSNSFTAGPEAVPNKVIYNNETIMDLTDSTVSERTLMSGYTAHDKAGFIINGTFVQGKLIEVYNEAAMNNLLVATNEGKSYIYLGTSTANYTNGNIYTVEVS